MEANTNQVHDRKCMVEENGYSFSPVAAAAAAANHDLIQSQKS